MIGIRDLIVSFILMNEHGIELLMKHRVSVLTAPEVEEVCQLYACLPRSPVVVRVTKGMQW